MCMVGYQLGNTLTENGKVSRGVCEIQDGYLTSVTEHTALDKNSGIPLDTIVSMNMWGFNRSYLDEAMERFPAFLDAAVQTNPLKAEFYLPTVVSQLLGEGKARVRVLSSKDKWYGVTYKEDKPVVVAALQALRDAGVYPKNLWGNE